jgi:prophage regulatory protein
MSDPLIRMPAVLERTGLSKTSLYRMIDQGRFPDARRIGPRAVAWYASEISAWTAALPLAHSGGHKGGHGLEA